MKQGQSEFIDLVPLCGVYRLTIDAHTVLK